MIFLRRLFQWIDRYEVMLIIGFVLVLAMVGVIIIESIWPGTFP